MQLTDDHLAELVENGYIILHEYYNEERRKPLAEAQRRQLKTWEEVKHDPPQESSMYVPGFPNPEQVLNQAILERPLIDFARRFLKTDAIFYKPGYMIARYPGFKGELGAHVDNGNNSLLPVSETAREYSTIGFWTHLEDVDEDQAPILLMKNKDGNDVSKGKPLVCKAGTVMAFSTYCWHATSPYRSADGQRFTWGFGFCRADAPWVGFRHYTDKGLDPHFREFIGTLSAEDRLLFRFPAPGHPYYTEQTLRALEDQYPGWNARGEYQTHSES